MSRTDLSTRVAVVSGASAGIGEAVARHLVASGAPTVLNARRAARIEQLASDLGSDRCAVAAGDAAEQSTVDAMLDTARDRFERDADLVVVNAGRGLNAGVLGSDDAQWESMIRVNLLGAMRLMRAAAHRMLADIEARGSWEHHPHDIIVLGSVVGRHVSPFSGAYGTTKFAVHAAVEALRREICGRGVRVTVIEPAVVVSEFQDVAGYADAMVDGLYEKFGPLLEPADVAEAIGWVAAQPARVHIGELLIRPTRQDYP